MTQPLRILIVDDQRRARLSLRALLASNFPAAEVSEAASGEEALRQANARPPDLVIMDAHMPGQDGVETTRQIKAAWPGLPVIVLSLYPDYQAPALAANADAFVSKGEPLERLLAAVTAAIARDSGPGANHAAAP